MAPMGTKQVRNSQDVGAKTPQDQRDASVLDVGQIVAELNKFGESLIEKQKSLESSYK